MNYDIAIGMLGCGTVGKGVVNLLQTRQKLYAERIQALLGLSKILVRDLQQARPGVPTELLTTDPAEILEDPEIQIVIEVMGGIEPAHDYILQALRAGKHVVTANKALIARHGTELFAAAAESGVALHFEAAVAGGIPIIQTLKRSLVANQIDSIYGIINGTTNYILSAMSDAGSDFQAVLREAQAQGFAEADPTDDIEGFDAAYKLAILAGLIFNQQINIQQIHRVGIQHISAEDMTYARRFGYVIKLLAIAKRTASGIEARVHPAMIPHDHPLASVNGVYNALLVNGDAVGELMFYGRGAGQMPTASAIVGDLLNLAAELDAPPNLLMSAAPSAIAATLSPADAVMNRYFIRLQTHDLPGVLGQIGALLGQEGISIHTLVQTKNRPGEAELVIISHPVSELRLRQAVAQIRQLENVREIESIIRVEDFSEH